MRNYASLTYGFIVLLFVEHMASASEKLQPKARLWDNFWHGNVRLSMAKSSQLLSIDIKPRHVDWVMVETSSEGLAELLAMIWSDSYSLVPYLIFLVQHNTRER